MKLDIAGVSVDIDKAPIVADANLFAHPGEVVALVGPNGCGKSTLLRTVYRALRARTGSVLIGGDDVARLTARQSARRTAVVAQEAASDFEFTAYEVVAMGRTPHHRALERDGATDRAVCMHALEHVGMRPLARRLFSTLSGGEKQCVLVARAIAQQTQLLILDEPTNHLDINYQHEILSLVRSLGLTTVAALHDLSLAATYCDRIYVMQEGRIVAAGPPHNVLTAEIVRTVFAVQLRRLRDPDTGRLHLAFERLDTHADVDPQPAPRPVLSSPGGG